MIRNGFVRDKDGAWHNLKNIIKLRVMETVKDSFAVFAIMEVGLSLVQISEEKEDEHDTYCFLDDLMGYE